ncbi:MAG: response regulator transcription factor, partial [bacterium]
MQKKILVVEDEKEIANIIKDFLEIEGFEVKTVDNGKKAIDIFNSFLPNLVILDIMLPETDGMELCRIFRNSSDIPIIMVSAKDGDVDKILSLGFGADDYVTKPFSPTELVARVKAHLRRYVSTENKTNNNSKLIFNSLEIDEDSFAVYVNNKKVNLVPKEFEVLLLLEKNE